MKKILLFVAAIMSCVSVMGQWNPDPAVNMQVWPNESFYSTDMQETPDGCVWLAVYHPFHVDDENGTRLYGGCTVALQLYDSLGYARFEQPIEVSNYASRTYVSCGDFFYVDRDGNAIVAIYDWRQGEENAEGLSVYKISPEGEFLWGEDGITLDGENLYDEIAFITMSQMTDGSYVFAWAHTTYPANYYHRTIELQRVSAEGEMLWNPEDVRMFDENISYSDSYLVDGGSNTVILLYSKGSAQDIYARKIDFEGASVWSEDVCIYNGGWGSVPIWTVMQVHPVAGGGLMVSWNDDRWYEQIEHPYMVYVKTNGELGFTIDNGQLLSLSQWRTLNVKSLYDEESDCFYAMWNECSSSQAWNSVVAQRISKEGELLWGDYGIELKPMELTNYGYFSVQSALNDEIAFFYMRSYTNNYTNVEAFVTTVNVNDTIARREREFTKGSRISCKAGLKSTPMIDGKYWVTKWTDNGSHESDEELVDRLLMQRVNYDFTLGAYNADDAVEAVRNENNTFVALATMVENEAMFATNFAVATQATLAIYDVNGVLVATPFDGVLAAGKQYIEWNANVPAGIYIATLTTAQGVETVKLLVK